jgi:hypothetical protein
VYRLGAPEVSLLWRTLRDLGSARLAEVDRLVQTYLTDRASLAAVDLNELEHRLAELPREREIVAYCRGPYCVCSLTKPRNSIDPLRDVLGVPWAIGVIAALTFASGAVVLGRMYETLPSKRAGGAFASSQARRSPQAEVWSARA